MYTLQINLFQVKINTLKNSNDKTKNKYYAFIFLFYYSLCDLST